MINTSNKVKGSAKKETQNSLFLSSAYTPNVIPIDADHVDFVDFFSSAFVAEANGKGTGLYDFVLFSGVHWDLGDG